MVVDDLQIMSVYGCALDGTSCCSVLHRTLPQTACFAPLAVMQHMKITKVGDLSCLPAQVTYDTTALDDLATDPEGDGFPQEQDDLLLGVNFTRFGQQPQGRTQPHRLLMPAAVGPIDTPAGARGTHAVHDQSVAVGSPARPVGGDAAQPMHVPSSAASSSTAVQTPCGHRQVHRSFTADIPDGLTQQQDLPQQQGCHGDSGNLAIQTASASEQQHVDVQPRNGVNSEVELRPMFKVCCCTTACKVTTTNSVQSNHPQQGKFIPYYGAVILFP